MLSQDSDNHNNSRKTSNQRQRSAPHPRYNLQKAEALAKTIFEQGARHCDPDIVARAVGYKNARSGPFKGLKAASSYFGLVDSGRKGTLSLTQHWIDAFHAEDLSRLKQARRDAMITPDVYKQLIEDYKDRQLPDIDKLERELYLNQKYQILKDAAPLAAQTFLESASYAELIDSRGFLQLSDDPPQDLASSNFGAENETFQQETLQSSQLEPELEESIETQGTRNSELSNPPLEINLPHNCDDLDRIEIKLRGGKKAFIFVPSPLAREDKDRLKGHIDLVLEPEEEDVL